MSARVVTFGELMLRLGPPGFERLLQSPMLCATFGGGEANVAVSLAQFGVDSHYVTRLPSNAIGDAAVRALRAEGVVTEFIARGGSRMGIYFTETGASVHPRFCMTGPTPPSARFHLTRSIGTG
jgi:2-dehydro-3-deoxygluconokinase